MAMKRIVSGKAAEERTFEKLRRDIETLPPGGAERAGRQAEMAALKARMAARRRAKGV